jgi:hypothetical protein
MLGAALPSSFNFDASPRLNFFFSIVLTSQSQTVDIFERYSVLMSQFNQMSVFYLSFFPAYRLGYRSCSLAPFFKKKWSRNVFLSLQNFILLKEITSCNEK